MMIKTVIIKNTFLLTFLLVTLAFTIPSGATSVTGINMDEVFLRSEFVFEGKVINIESHLTNNSKMIRTHVTFKITDLIKGKKGAVTISISFLGGQIGNQILEVSDMVLPKMGEKGIYFVESQNKEQVHPLTGWSQGHFIVIKDNAGTERITTWEKVPVSDISTTNSSFKAISIVGSGHAKDLRLAKPSEMYQAMTAENFKQRLKNFTR